MDRQTKLINIRVKRTTKPIRFISFVGEWSFCKSKEFAICHNPFAGINEYNQTKTNTQTARFSMIVLEKKSNYKLISALINYKYKPNKKRKNN